MGPSRCVLLFARRASEEARAKRIGSAAVFALARRRIERIARVVGARLVVASQTGATFGERLARAFASAAAQYDEVVVVPTDVPQLTARDVRRAFALLRSHDMVLGPCPDGGVYLIGGRAGARLADVRWLTPHVWSAAAMPPLCSRRKSGGTAAALQKEVPCSANSQRSRRCSRSPRPATASSCSTTASPTTPTGAASPRSTGG